MKFLVNNLVNDLVDVNICFLSLLYYNSHNIKSQITPVSRPKNRGFSLYCKKNLYFFIHFEIKIKGIACFYRFYSIFASRKS